MNGETESLPDSTSLETRPGIFIVGSSNVGKRTLLSRLISVDFDDSLDSLPEVFVHGWTINTKYYTADVVIGLSHLQDDFCLTNVPIYDRLAALVMVFDMSEISTLVALQDWVSRTEINNFDILLCIGNKVDLVSGHPVHAEYRRHQLKVAEESADRYSDISHFGISETEGSSLLADEEPSSEIRRLCMEWCCEHNIEFLEACASNTEFDKCLSVDGDSQGVERLVGALSAHMWPGMILKSGHKITEPSLPEGEEFSEEESDYELEYEVLSAGSADPWDDIDERWVSANQSSACEDTGASVSSPAGCDNNEHIQPKSSSSEIVEEATHDGGGEEKEYNNKTYEFEDLEHLMSEIGNVRNNLRLMPDFQRREMAAKLAMKMATMFGDDSDDNNDIE